ncbi:hypothetical protein S40285_07450, partial [Stachybotrys chlorohalonatus IBT 40285]
HQRKAADNEIALSSTQTVIVSLVSRLLAAIYHVLFDNLFSSPHLFRALRDRGIAATGTCRTNCGLYEPIVVAKQQDHQGQEFTHRVRHRPLTIGTSCLTKKAFSKNRVKKLPMLAAIAAYNDQMGAVDIGDQLQATEGLDHCIRLGGWRAIAWTFLLEVALVNGYLLQPPGLPPGPPHIRVEMAEGIGAASGLAGLLNTVITWFDYVLVAKQAAPRLQSLLAAGLTGSQIEDGDSLKSAGSFQLDESEEQLAITTLRAVAALFEEYQKLCHREREGKSEDNCSV